jgi:Ca2+-binding EF-hand superfamily protein
MEINSPEFDLENVFKKYDKGNKSFLSPHELRCAFIFLHGVRPSYKEMKTFTQIKENYHEKQINENKSVKKNEEDKEEKSKKALIWEKGFNLELFKLLSKVRQNYLKEDSHSEIKQIFESLDIEGRDFIRIEDYLNLLKKHFKTGNYKSMLNAFYEIDSNKDGRVTFKDFYQLFKFKI